MAHFVIVIAMTSPCIIATPNAVCDCCFAIAVVGLHSSCSIINNNVNTPSIKISIATLCRLLHHVVVCVTIAITIVGSRSGCSCCCGVLIAIAIVGSLSGTAVLF